MILVAVPNAAWAQGATTLPTVTVTAPPLVMPAAEPVVPPRTALSPDPATLPAHTTIIGRDAVERRPVASYGDLFRPVTGMNVNNYGQGGVGYGLSLRGFTDAEHGRDIAYVIDGVPINEVSSLHTPNYADLNVLLPETVERIEIMRGPFNAEYGDGALGGAIVVTTKTSDPDNLIGASGGTYGQARGVATYSTPRIGAVQPFLALEGYTDDGYRTNSGFQRFNSFNKFTMPAGDGVLSARVQGFGGNFGAPGYVSRDGVLARRIAPTRATNGADGGEKLYESGVVNYALGPRDQALTMNSFVNHDWHVRFSDFGSGQRRQLEDRGTFGLNGKKVWTGTLFDALPVQVSTGGNLRADRLDALQGPTVNRHVAGRNTVDVHVDEYNLGAFTQAQIKPVEWLKITGGARYDHYVFDIEDHLTPANTASPDMGAVSPKAGLAVRPTSWLELFGNYGEGVRAPSATAGGELLGARNLKPLSLESKEVGVQLDPVSRLRVLATAWTTDLTREIFQPAPGLTVQNLGRSRRQGIDVETRVDLERDEDGRTSVFASYDMIRATLINQGAGSQFVPNVPKSIVTVGLDLDQVIDETDRLYAELFVQFIGRKNLSEDGGVKTKPYERVSGRVAYGLPEGWTGFVQATWYPGDRTSESAFNFGPTIGARTSDIVTSPQAEATVMVGVSYRFGGPR